MVRGGGVQGWVGRVVSSMEWVGRGWWRSRGKWI